MPDEIPQSAAPAADSRTEPPKARRSKLKIVLFLLGGGIGLGILALTVVVWQIDNIGRKVIEEGGTKALGVETKLEKLSLSIFGGTCALDELTIANPEGFSAPHFFRMDRGEAAISLASLTDDRIVAPYLRLHGIDLNMQKGDGKANYEIILDNLKKQESEPEATDPKSTETEPSEPTDKPGKQFVIKEVLLTDIRVKAELSLTGLVTREYDIRIKRIRLQDVGSESKGGAIVSELWGTIMKAVLSAVLREGADILPDVMKDGLGASLEGLKGIGGRSVKIAGKGIGAAESVIEGVGKGIGSLFGGKKKTKKTTAKTEEKKNDE
ncbi:MAG: hypothetical protein V3T86_10185 [Planctomycetota bacterium]